MGLVSSESLLLIYCSRRLSGIPFSPHLEHDSRDFLPLPFCASPSPAAGLPDPPIFVRSRLFIELVLECFRLESVAARSLPPSSLLL